MPQATTHSLPPLQIHLLFHPRSKRARELAKAMFAELMARPGFPGLRIPVLYACDDGTGSPPTIASLQREPAARRLICLLADDQMVQRTGGEPAPWGEFARKLLRRRQPRGTVVMPIAVDGGAFHLHDDLTAISFVRLDVKPTPALQQDELFFQIAVRALEVLRRRDTAAGNVVTTTEVAPLQVFVSHAKANLPRDPERHDQNRGPVLEMLDYLAQGPVRGWFDSSQIRPGSRFDQAIGGGVDASTAVLAVHTDAYSSREWCRREYLLARQRDLPIVVVDALEGVDPAEFPYFGNVPRIRWTTPTDGLSMPRRVMRLLLQEALRHGLVVAARDSVGPGEHHLPRQPDLLSLQALPRRKRRIVYPDPPLPKEMIDVLRQQDGSRQFVTPMSRVDHPALAGKKIALSLAEASDIHRVGKGDEHLQVMIEDLACLLLLSRAELGYGGAFKHGHDYTTALLDRARSLRTLVDAAGGPVRLAPVTHFATWPKHLDANDEDLQAYRTAHLRKTKEPDHLLLREQLAEPGLGAYFRREPPANVTWPPELRRARQYAHARGVGAMRIEMNHWLDARICIGGKLSGYNGVIPGVVEEIWLAIMADKPVYLLSAFGGATELVYDLLRGEARHELDPEFLRGAVTDHDGLVASYAQTGQTAWDPRTLHSGLWRQGLQRLRNGLDDRANERLADATDPFQIAEMVAQGMRNLAARG